MRKPAKHCFAGGCPALSLERTGEDFNRGRFAPMRRHGGLHDTEPSLLKIPFMKFCRFAPTFSGQVNRLRRPRKRSAQFQSGRLRLFCSSQNLYLSGLCPPFPGNVAGGSRHIPVKEVYETRRKRLNKERRRL